MRSPVSVLVFLAGICSCSSSCGGKGDAPATLKSWDVCATGWPAAPSPQPLQSPLSVTPSLLWVKDLAHGGLGLGGLAVAGDRLAVSTGNQVQIVSRSGDILHTYTDSRLQVHSPPTADAAGNVYVVTQSGIHSIDNDANDRWHAYVFDTSPNDPELLTLPPPVLSPEGRLYAKGSHPGLVSVDAKDGGGGWGLPDGGSPIAGAGLLLFVSGSPSTRVLDTTTHAFVGQLDPGAGQATVLGFPVRSNGTRHGCARIRPRRGRHDVGRVRRAGDVRKSPWTFRDGVPQLAGLIGADERLITVAWDGNANTSVMRSLTDTWVAYTSDGTRAAGPSTTADLPILGARGGEVPMFSGADGTTYGVLCDDNPLDVLKSWLIAYGTDLKEQWRVDISPACPTGNGVFTDDGVAYFTRRSDVDVELIAVQTTSPGLAKSSWPTLRHDNQGTSWLSP